MEREIRPQVMSLRSQRESVADMGTSLASPRSQTVLSSLSVLGKSYVTPALCPKQADCSGKDRAACCLSRNAPNLRGAYGSTKSAARRQ